MTNQTPRDQKQLEQATARSLPPGTPLDDDTATLRDGWLSVGSAVDQANADFSEAVLLAQLLTGPESNSQVEPARPATMPEPVAAWRGWPAILAGALALTMLLAVARTLWEANREPLAANSLDTAGTVQTSGDASGDEIGWSDPLDDELDDAADQVRSLIARATRVDASLSVLAEKLDLMSSDLSNDSL